LWQIVIRKFIFSVFAVKYRTALIDSEWRERLHQS
jgi:hypothetical protein